MPPDEEEAPGQETKWAGFSDYQDVAAQLHQDINKAVEAYAHVDSKTSQNIGLTPQTAVAARSAILKITKRLFREVEKMSHKEPFDEISKRWSDGDDGEPGYVTKLESTDFYNDGVPYWLGDLIDDLVTAGWELGYLKAGMEKPANPNDDDVQVKEMID
jgi:hypothetical protein